METSKSLLLTIIASFIAIPGLASHPFGSWQAKDDPSRSWMWIRDAVPKVLPSARTILFGYDSKLVSSNSFQTIDDLALFLVNELEVSGLAKPDTKPIVFIAHSLGGIVLKEGLCKDDRIVSRTIGSILFGVPSHGMDTTALKEMVRGQPNENLLRDLSLTDSNYLAGLKDRFFQVAISGNMTLFWAYETKESPTVAVCATVAEMYVLY
jgi:hypothetical protein